MKVEGGWKKRSHRLQQVVCWSSCYTLIWGYFIEAFWGIPCAENSASYTSCTACSWGPVTLHRRPVVGKLVKIRQYYSRPVFNHPRSGGRPHSRSSFPFSSVFCCSQFSSRVTFVHSCLTMSPFFSCFLVDIFECCRSLDRTDMPRHMAKTAKFIIFNENRFRDKKTLRRGRWPTISTVQHCLYPALEELFSGMGSRQFYRGIGRG